MKLGEEVRSITDPIELKQRVCRRISESLHVPRVEITANGPGPTHEIAFPSPPEPPNSATSFWGQN